MGKSINKNIWRYISKKNIILGNIYRPPRNTVNDYNIFTREFTGALEYLENLGPEILIAGDYNINLLKVSYHSLHFLLDFLIYVAH